MDNVEWLVQWLREKDEGMPGHDTYTEAADTMQALYDVVKATEWYITDAAYKAPEQAADGISVLKQAFENLWKVEDGQR